MDVLMSYFWSNLFIYLFIYLFIVKVEWTLMC